MTAMVGHSSLTKGGADDKELLLGHVKKEVKQIMEEAVTRKFIHEDSSSVMSLCGAIEACLRHRLKRQALGLFKSKDSTSSLLHKVSKVFEPAAEVSRLTKEVEASLDSAKANSAVVLDDNRNHIMAPSARLQAQRHIWIRIALFQKVLARIIDYLVDNSWKYYEKDALMSDPCEGPLLASLLEGPCALEFTKMKTADHLWSDPHADELVLRHRIQGGSGSSLGVCIGGSGSSICINASAACASAAPGAPPHRRLTLGAKTSKSSSSSDESATSSLRTPPSAKDYVESLHQNGKATLLYGKNNVLVQPTHDGELLPGYLALHQSAEGVTLSWTPNQLMRGGSVDSGAAADSDIDDTSRSGAFLLRVLESPKPHPYQRYLKPKDALYWDYAMKVNMDDIVYLHCHQQRGQDNGGTLVMVGQDGVPRPPVHFPRGGSGGGHLLAFLSCLEAGLQPLGQLDPPLWSQEDKGKVFPKVKRKWSHSHVDSCTSGTKPSKIPSAGSTTSAPAVSDSKEDASSTEIDYVFRIVHSFNPQALDREILMDVKPTDSSLFSWEKLRMPRLSLPWAANGVKHSKMDAAGRADESTAMRLQLQCRQSTPKDAGGRIQKMLDPFPSTAAVSTAAALAGRSSLRQLCNTMTRQIISRAFYGWLAHCRHLRTVRTHLAGLVHGRLMFPVPELGEKNKALTAEYWHALTPEDMVQRSQDIYKKIYYGGMCHEIRKEVWPYLLGHHHFGWCEKKKSAADDEARANYELIMSRWLAVESIVKLREQEKQELKAAEVAAGRMDSGSVDSVDSLAVMHRLCRKVSSLSNEVFLECDSAEGPAQGGNASSAAAERSDAGSGHASSAGNGTNTSSATERRLRKSQRLQSTEELQEGSEDSSESENETNGSTGEAAVSARLDAHDDRARVQQEAALHSEAAGAQAPAVPAGSNAAANHSDVAAGEEVYSVKFLDDVALNLHRIDKDVHRCDRNYWYFNVENLKKLRNVVCTYVWENLDVGYVQGMCDLVAPLLVVLDDESLTYSCFCALMKRMADNFPLGTAMDRHLANMRSLAQVLDPELFEHMQHTGDFTHFYFSYRWLLLDLKRELVYDDVFLTWETIWVAKHVCSSNFVLFIALALVECYRDIILENAMDFTDVIKFFNEMAEKHSARRILRIARELVYRLQQLVENKLE